MRNLLGRREGINRATQGGRIWSVENGGGKVRRMRESQVLGRREFTCGLEWEMEREPVR